MGKPTVWTQWQRLIWAYSALASARRWSSRTCYEC